MAGRNCKCRKCGGPVGWQVAPSGQPFKTYYTPGGTLALDFVDAVEECSQCRTRRLLFEVRFRAPVGVANV